MKAIRTRIIFQVSILFFIGVLVVGTTAYFSQRALTDANVKKQMESFASEVAEEVNMAVREYPLYEWLIRYWYEHSDELDIEYDIDYSTGIRTRRKARILSERHPGIQLKYAVDVELWPEEDQKLYAEITYSWLITHINQIKKGHDIDYLFCVITDDKYDSQFFLFSAADENSVRGTKYEQAYTLGVTVSVAGNESQQRAMRRAHTDSAYLAYAGNYVDYYAYMNRLGDKSVLFGMTISKSELLADIDVEANRGTIFAIANQIVLSLVCLGLISLFVIRPLRSVQQNIRLYKETKDSGKVIRNLAEAVTGHNEIRQLSDDVADLAREIDDYVSRIEDITAERQRIGTELELAARIQANTLPNQFPPFPDRHEFDIYASMTPAKEVGGDFYDFFMIDDDHLAVLIADVSGKGVPAALFMMVSMILIRNAAKIEDGPAKVLESVNEQICANNPEEMFVSVWLGVLEISTGSLVAANAGHEYPAVKRAGGSFELLKDRHGFVVGGMSGVRYSEYAMQLEPGDKIFVYTDGVPEATDGNLKLFGTQRMIDALRGAEDGSPTQILGAINRAVQAFVGDVPQFDDLTMLCVEYRGEAG